MKICLIPSTVTAGPARPQYLTSFLVNDSVALDVGCLGLCAAVDEQARIGHVFVSHSHLDHIASLPIFLENVYALGQAVNLYAGEETLQDLRTHLFNNRLWPDMFSLRVADGPFITVHTLQSAVPVQIGSLAVTPIAVSHTLPTFGFLVHDGAAAVLIVMDTGPTEAIWQVANQRDDLKAVFLEVSFPDSMQWLAASAKHLTPLLFKEELGKLGKAAPVYAVHIKAAFQQRVLHELEQLQLPQVRIAESGRCYEF